jgi:sulfur relay (sulfurtransferase) complex TusBCD TusD component (DsrE family)
VKRAAKRRGVSEAEVIRTGLCSPLIDTALAWGLVDRRVGS